MLFKIISYHVMMSYVVLYYIMLCHLYFMMCYVMLWCVMVHYVMRCYIMSWCVILCYITSRYKMLLILFIEMQQNITSCVVNPYWSIPGNEKFLFFLWNVFVLKIFYAMFWCLFLFLKYSVLSNIKYDVLCSLIIQYNKIWYYATTTWERVCA